MLEKVTLVAVDDKVTFASGVHADCPAGIMLP